MKRAFAAADANDNGNLTDDETASMMWWLSERLDATAERGYGVLSTLADLSTDRK